MNRNPTWWALVVAMAMVGCGGGAGSTFPVIEKTTGALTPVPYVNTLLEMDTTWREAVPPIQSMLEGWISADYCPEPVIQVKPGPVVSMGTTVYLDGTGSIPESGAMVTYLWSVHQPPQHGLNLVPSMSFPKPTHLASYPGVYRYCLDVWDEAHGSKELECLSTACVEVKVSLEYAIEIELTWETPGDLNQFDGGPHAGSDMDLHFAHPFATGPDLDGDGKPDGWFDLAYDCFWFNPSPGWESMNPNVADDPGLVLDDDDGAGPEIVLLDVPGERIYKVGVHYWNDHGFGPSYPRVRIYIFGKLVFDMDLYDTHPMETCDLWEVATIDWPSGEVAPILHKNGDPKIIGSYANPAFVQYGGTNCP